MEGEQSASSFEAVTREHLATLAKASAKLAESLDYETTLHAIPRLALPALGDMCMLEVLEEGNAQRHFVHAHSDERRTILLSDAGWETLSLGEGLYAQPFIQTQIDDAWIENVARSPDHAALLRSLAFGSVMYVPLSSRGNILGTLTWLRKVEAERTHTPLDLELGEELARRVVAAMENARLFKEARDAIGIRDDFLSIAGHELRTPLTALQLQVLSIERMLKGEIDVEKIRARAEKAARNVVRLSTLVNELLDISRISAGRLTLQLSQFDLSEPVFEVLGRMADELVRAGCTIDVKLEGELRGSWDRLRIEQIVTNLVSNATKYGQGKPIEVRLSPRAGKACLSVRDFGVGISPEDQKRIFERFERAVPSRHSWGLGLGLWIARQLIEAHGGTIRVESAPGAGATFEVELALERSDAST